MSFKIVKFLDESEQNEVAIVHKNWFVGPDEESVRWPPYWKQAAKLNKAVLVGESPNKSTWSVFKVTVIRTYGKPL